MTLWDHIKPAPARVVPTRIERAPDGRTISFVWSDGATTTTSAQKLRQNCPCASCVEEQTGKRTLDPSTIPDSLSVNSLEQVGSYALAFVFSDGHRTGIYSWPGLRAL